MEKKQSLWSSKSLGNRLQHGFFYLLVKCRLIFLAKCSLYVVVFWYSLKLSVRQKSLPYLAHMFGPMTFFQSWLHSYRLYLNFAFVLLDRTILGITGRFNTQKNEAVEVQIKKLLSLDKGLVAISAHFGDWQGGMAGLAFLDTPVNICLFQSDQDVDKQYFDYQKDDRFKIISTALPFGGTLEMVNALKNNEIVCFMGDRRLYDSDPAMSVNFLGESVYFPYTAYAIAGQTQSPVMIFFLPKNEAGDALISVCDHFFVPKAKINDTLAFAPYVERFVRHFEAITKQYPYLFFNFFDLWKK